MVKCPKLVPINDGLFNHKSHKLAKKMDKVFSSTKHDFNSYYMQSAALGKETEETDTWLCLRLQVRSPLYSVGKYQQREI